MNGTSRNDIWTGNTFDTSSISVNDIIQVASNALDGRIRLNKPSQGQAFTDYTVRFETTPNVSSYDTIADRIAEAIQVDFPNASGSLETVSGTNVRFVIDFGEGDIDIENLQFEAITPAPPTNTNQRDLGGTGLLDLIGGTLAVGNRAIPGVEVTYDTSNTVFVVKFPPDNEALLDTFRRHSGTPPGTDLSVLLGLSRGTEAVNTVEIDQTSHTQVGTIYFSRVTEVPIWLTVHIRVSDRTRFPANGIPTIIENVLDYANGIWLSGEGQFDLTGIEIGESIDQRRMQTPINAVPGHEIVLFRLNYSNAMGAIGEEITAENDNPDLNTLYTLVRDRISVLIV